MDSRSHLLVHSPSPVEHPDRSDVPTVQLRSDVHILLYVSSFHTCLSNTGSALRLAGVTLQWLLLVPFSVTRGTPQIGR